MGEDKYGRLFTEADVIRIIQAARFQVRREPGEDPQAWPRDMLASFDGDLPADEPLFLLRGQDRAAPYAINTPGDSWDYLTACDRMGAGPPHTSNVMRAAWRMHDWQEANPDRVKVPD